MTEGEQLTVEFAAAFIARDLESMCARAREDCVISALRSGLEGDFVGHEGLRRWAHGFWEWLGDGRITLDRISQVDESRVLVLGTQGGTARSGGPAFEAPLAFLAVTSGGLLQRLTAFPTHEEAVRAAGVSG